MTIHKSLKNAAKRYDSMIDSISKLSKEYIKGNVSNNDMTEEMVRLIKNTATHLKYVSSVKISLDGELI